MSWARGRRRLAGAGIAGFQQNASISATSSRSIPASLGPVLTAAVLSFCLLRDSGPLKESRDLASVLGEVSMGFGEARTQWIVFVCGLLYLLTFTLLRRRWAQVEGERERIEDRNRASTVHTSVELAGEWFGEPGFCVAGLMGVAGLAYTLDYPQEVKSTQALTLLGGAVLEQGAGFWAEWSRKPKLQSQKPGRGTVVGVLVLLLTAAERAEHKMHDVGSS